MQYIHSKNSIKSLKYFKIKTLLKETACPVAFSAGFFEQYIQC